MESEIQDKSEIKEYKDTGMATTGTGLP